jgi:hypothetical protein
MLLLRRFLVMLMKRIAAFCHGQQLVVPIIFFLVFGVWQFVIQKWSWEEFKCNPWTTSFPYITTCLIFLVVQIILAVRDLSRELIAERAKDKPRIIGAEILQRPAPSRVLKNQVGGLIPLPC